MPAKTRDEGAFLGIKPFALHLPEQIRFGRGIAGEAADAIAAAATGVLVIHGAHSARAGWLVEGLKERGVAVATFACPREPDVPLVEAAVATGRQAQAQAITGLGGGAVIDLAKAVAGLVPAKGSVMDYLEVVGGGRALDAPPMPFFALPTTAGTGAEVTANAVIDVPDAQRKVSLRDPRLLPRGAFVDPALTDHCPRSVTLASGLDAITQVIEPFLSGRANAFTDTVCRDAVPRGLAALPRLMGAEDSAARDEMAWVSLCGGLALANAKLGAVHGLAGPLGGVCTAPHGAIAGALLPPVLKANEARVDGEVARRLQAVKHWIAAALGGVETDALDTLADWARGQGLPGLAAAGVDRDALPAIARAAAGSSSMQGNPVVLPADDLVAAMEAAW